MEDTATRVGSDDVTGSYNHDVRSDIRHQYIFARLRDFLSGGDPVKMEELVQQCNVNFTDGSPNFMVIHNMLQGTGASTLLFTYQPRSRRGKDQGRNLHQEQERDEGEETNVLMVLNPLSDAIEHVYKRSVYLMRPPHGRPISSKDLSQVVQDIVMGVLQGDVVASYEHLLTEIYTPLLNRMSRWGKNTLDDRNKFIMDVMHYTDRVGELQQLQSKETIRLSPIDAGVWRRLASGSSVGAGHAMQELGLTVSSWLTAVESVIADVPNYEGELQDERVGPRSEIEIWKSRLARLRLVDEQLTEVSATRAVQYLREAKSLLMSRWRAMDEALTEATAEAHENVKYLQSFNKYFDVLYSSNLQQIMGILPALMTNIRMMYTIARYYPTREHMTALFFKITNALVLACKRAINPSGTRARIWDLTQSATSLADLLNRLQVSTEVNVTYVREYRRVQEELRESGGGQRGFDFDELRFLGHFNLFVKRLDKLLVVFRKVRQFALLKEYHVEPMEALLPRFDEYLGHLRGKTTDILDIHDNNRFDVEFKSFETRLSELETSMQVAINSSFENITSTESALTLLKKYQKTLDPATFAADLESKYLVVFHTYGMELEKDQKTYERYKADPPMARDSAPVAGAIQWARQLLRHIKEPMDQFRGNRAIMANTKENKKVIRTYNKLSVALLEFEAIWLDAWRRSIESSRAGLSATLLVRHQGRLYVNLDSEIMQLIKETRALLLLGDVEVPAMARTVLMHEQRLKTFHAELSHLVREMERIVGAGRGGRCKVVAITRPLLQPLIDHLYAVFREGETTLTWSSMNVDGYLARVRHAVAALDAVVSSVNEVMAHRIQSSLRAIAHISLVDLSAEHYTLDQFVQTQERHIRQQCRVMEVKNREVASAVEDVIDIIAAGTAQTSSPSGGGDGGGDGGGGEDEDGGAERPPPSPLLHSMTLSMGKEDDALAGSSVFAAVRERAVEDKASVLRGHVHRLMFHAILTCTTRSLHRLKRRIATRTRGDAFLCTEKPLFDVDVQLLRTPPHFFLSPSLEEVQRAINACATAILSCSKYMTNWTGRTTTTAAAAAPPPLPSFYEAIAKNKEVVKVVLLLTGGVHGLKKLVMEYLGHFRAYEHLWRREREAVYAEFVAAAPTLEDYEAVLQEHEALERRLAALAPGFRIGSVALQITPLQTVLRQWVREWRDLYANSLYRTAQRQLDGLTQTMEEEARQLSLPIPDQEKLEELRVLMNTLRAIRDRESRVDFEFQPIQQAYHMLQRYGMAIPAEEMDCVEELRFRWRKLHKAAQSSAHAIHTMQHDLKRGLTQEVQKFGAEVVVFRNDYNAHGPMVEGLRPQEAMERLKRYQRQFDDKYRKWMTLMAGEELFGLPLHRYPELVRTRKELELLDKLYTLYINVLHKVHGYNDILWCDLDFDAVCEEVSVFVGQCRRLPRSLREWDAYLELKRILDDFMELQPVIQELKNPAVGERHWQEIMRVTGHRWRTDPDLFKLQDLVDANLLAVVDEVVDTAMSSVREADIETKFRQQEALWKDQELHFSEFKHRGPIVLKGDDTTAVREGLDESSLAVNAMLSSRYCGFMRETIQSFLQKLVKVSETIGLWTEVQFTWQYLEAVFAGGDIMKQLPQEAKRFAIIDKNWQKIMNKANEMPNVIDFCYENELLQSLPTLKEQLDECQRKLSLYLEQKRNLFPRFYFVSDTVLLEILSQASDPQSIQPHLSSIFDGLAAVRFERVKPKEAGGQGYFQIVEMISGEGQSLRMREPTPCVGNVEDWLTRLCTAMTDTVRDVVKASVTELPTLLSNVAYLGSIIECYPAQVALLLLQFFWTADVTECIGKGAMVRGRGRDGAAARGRCDAVKNFLVNITTSPELERKPARMRTNIETLITVQVHQQEVFMELQKSSIREVTHFDWLKQARFYYKPERGVTIVSIADSDTEYCNEYLGVKERLVITPLTDRCYITLSQALAMYMGGAPAGPAGTGKTETTKDLARTYGKFCVVFNCSDQLDRHAMGKIIRGLSQANAWGCFDEFNRIDLPVLSVVAQQVSCVLQALKQHKERFVFIDGQATDLMPGVGFFITMNPGYAGRQELPENLKILFRGVTMMVPDRQTIMKVKLASQGYSMDELLSKKFFILYKLCEEQLSKQRHYDFGLRNILSVLRTAGAVLRRSPGKDEEELFMRTLRDMNLSKLVFEDMDLFDSLLRDMFPGRPFIKGCHPEVESTLGAVVAAKGLIYWGPWVSKVLQLYETKLVRHGIMVVGPAMCGKTQCYDVMTETLTRTTVPHQQLRMNPKAITAPQMFGRVDVAGDWHDGVFSSLWRQAVRHAKKRHVWIVCDGPVDAIWIENLNTVLDDNKLLTLANGDRIQMSDTMKCCFEVENLANASPATVSRAGIVYISDVVLGWQPVLESRLRATVTAEGHILPADLHRRCTPNQLAQHLLDLFLPSRRDNNNNNNNDAGGGGDTESGGAVTCATESMAEFYTRECAVVMPTSMAHLVVNAFYLAVALGDEITRHGGNTTAATSGGGGTTSGTTGGGGGAPAPAPASAPAAAGAGEATPVSLTLARQIYWFSMAWAFGGTLESHDRARMDRFIRDRVDPDLLPPAGEGEIFDYCLDCRLGGGGTAGIWVRWESFLEPWRYPGDDRLDFSTLFIPTADSVRLHYLTRCNFIQRRPTLLIGVSGTAKTVTMEKFLMRVKSEDDQSSFRKVNFSSMTTPQNFYNALEDMTEKKMGSSYGPKNYDRMTVFIDDINMPDINEWGDQITNEIVRQVVELSQVYDLSKPGVRKELKGLVFMAAMSHPTGGKNDIPNRLKRHFALVNVPLPSESSVQQIFGLIFEGRFGQERYTREVQEIARMLTAMSIDLWERMGRRMLPTPDKFHYLFNLRDLSRITQGIMLTGMFADPERPETRAQSRPWEVIRDGATLLHVWRHECTRVLGDKLNSVADKKWFDRNLRQCLRRHLEPSAHAALAEAVARDAEEEEEENNNNNNNNGGGYASSSVYLASFLRDPVYDGETGELAEPAPRVYEPAASMAAIQARLLAAMRGHNESAAGRVRRLDLVLFDAAVKHVCRISRGLALPRGNLLLVGVGGSGKQSLTRLAAFVNNHDYATLTISKGFGVNQLFDAIREQYVSAAMRRPVTMLFTDNDIKQEVFLEYINSFLSNGEIAGLFASDQRESAIGEVRGVAKRDPYHHLHGGGGGKAGDMSSDALWAYFIHRVRDRLHFVLCFSPVGEKFRTRARRFPALVSSCIIDWFFPWPRQALLEVSQRRIDTLAPILNNNNNNTNTNTNTNTTKSTNTNSNGTVKQGRLMTDALGELMAEIHTLMLARSEDYLARYRRSVYSTPKSYLGFIDAYLDIYHRKYSELHEDASKIASGLQKLHQAGEDVRVMRAELQEKEVRLGERRRATDALVREIERRTAEAEKKRAEVEAVKEVVAREAAVVAAGEAEAKKDLAAAEPALLEAIESLNSITANDFVTLKKLANPPALIKRIFDAVSILLHRPLLPPGAGEVVKGALWMNDSWEFSGRSLASDTGTLDVLKDFGQTRKDNINAETCELLLPYLHMDGFTAEAARKACGNVAGLCTWVGSMYKYINIAKIVAPKKEALRVATAKLRAANRRKEEQEEALRRVSAEVAAGNAQFVTENAKRAELEEDARQTRRRMDSANGLIDALSGERARWTGQSLEFRSLMERLVGDVAVSAAFISYCGPFNAEFRAQLLNEYFYPACRRLSIPVTADLDVVRFLVDATTIADWQMEGLPADSHSVQNAIMMTMSAKYALMIDPQGQALSWIRRRAQRQRQQQHAAAAAAAAEANQHDSSSSTTTTTTTANASDTSSINTNMHTKGKLNSSSSNSAGEVAVVQMSDRDFIHRLQQQLDRGLPLIIENVPAEVDAVMDPVLERQIGRSGKTLVVKINGEEMTYNESFSLFMTTKLPNPNFTPETFAKCLVIDFTVTMEGLEQQLLSHVVSREKAELNEERAKLTEDINSNEKRRKNLEDRLLRQLSESQGNLIDDVELIATLQETKHASAEIAEKLANAMETQRRIAGACEEYRPVARRGAVLYFLVVELTLVSHMYQTSLVQFNTIFDGSIVKSEHHPVTARRIAAMMEHLTMSVFRFVTRMLFSRHRLLFVLLMACKIAMKTGTLEPAAFEVFLKGGGSATATTTAAASDASSSSSHRVSVQQQAKPFPWMKEKAWANIVAIAQQVPRVFRQLPDLIARNESGWRPYMEAEAMESLPVPDLPPDSLDPFSHLLLVRALREDRTMLAAGHYVARMLGRAYAEPQQLELGDVLEETSGTAPIVFLLSQGSDPTALIEAYAKRLKKKVGSISMGQGQEESAMAMVSAAWQNGDWALLQNCHLGLPFLGQLEEKLRQQQQQQQQQSQQTSSSSPPPTQTQASSTLGGGGGGHVTTTATEVHPEARIWITSEPHDAVPIGLLQMSIKLTNEPPQGIKAGLIRTYSWMSQDYLEIFRRPEWRPMLFTQCFLHSLVVERRKFGPIGFSVPYEFNQGDWTASVQFLINHMTTIGEQLRNPVNRDTVCYMVADIQYGGRITDNNDRALFKAITEFLYDPRITNPGSVVNGGGSANNINSNNSNTILSGGAGTNANHNNSHRELTQFYTGYGIPLFDDIQVHREFIRATYPDVDTPEVFQMHPNQDITYRTRQAQEVLTTILDMQPRGGGAAAGGMTREAKVLAMAESYLKLLPEHWSPDRRVHLQDRQPLSIFAGQEMDRLAVTIQTVRRTCTDLKLAVAGTIILTPALQDAINYLYDARVPPRWVAVGWPSPNIALWMAELVRRYEQLNSWAVNGRPAVYWLPGFFNPQGFLTSVRQEITRSHAHESVPWALDKVEARTEVRGLEYRPGQEARAEDLRTERGEVVIYGLYLEGAMWDKTNKRLKDPLPGDLFRELPMLLISAFNKDAPSTGPTTAAAAVTMPKPGAIRERKTRQEYYRCPVYKYPSRSDINWIFDVNLPVAEDDAYWRMRGVALLGCID